MESKDWKVAKDGKFLGFDVDYSGSSPYFDVIGMSYSFTKERAEAYAVQFGGVAVNMPFIPKRK